MKAVILAGGLGTRMREETEFKPKPMVEIGGRPVLWHLMKIFSSQGIKEFVVLGGYKVEVIKEYFLNISANVSDFTVQNGEVVIHGQGPLEEDSWRVTVVDTGAETLTAGRLLKARHLIGDEPFVCTYGDGLADVEVRALLQKHENSNLGATMTIFQPENRFGVVQVEEGRVISFKEKPKMTDRINIGFFVFEPVIWDYLRQDEALEDSPLRRLSEDGALGAYEHPGFWMPMDTFREYSALSEMWKLGRAPWATWLK